MWSLFRPRQTDRQTDRQTLHHYILITIITITKYCILSLSSASFQQHHQSSHHRHLPSIWGLCVQQPQSPGGKQPKVEISKGFSSMICKKHIGSQLHLFMLHLWFQHQQHCHRLLTFQTPSPMSTKLKLISSPFPPLWFGTLSQFGGPG